jgi:hypothetical protein
VIGRLPHRRGPPSPPKSPGASIRDYASFGRLFLAFAAKALAAEAFSAASDKKAKIELLIAAQPDPEKLGHALVQYANWKRLARTAGLGATEEAGVEKKMKKKGKHRRPRSMCSSFLET